MTKYLIMNDSYYELNPTAGAIVLKYDSNKKQISIIDEINKETINNITNDDSNNQQSNDFVTKDELNEKLSEVVTCTWKIVGVLENESQLNTIENPEIGNICLIGDKEYLYVGEVTGVNNPWVELGTNINLNLSDYALKSEIPEVPTKTSDLTNDSGFLTEHQSLGNVSILENKLSYLEEQLNKLVKASSTIIVNSSNLSQPDEDLFIEIEEPIQGQVTNINGKSITVKQLDVANGRLNVVATDDVNFSNLTTEGNLPKSTSNAQVSINTSDYVKITDSEINQTSYNAIEIGLTNTSAPKSVIIDNINFEGTLSNNAILIFNTAENATINISNCTFKEVSNAVRLSNRDNVSGVTLNLINCEFGKWDSNPEYAGIVICEDYSSKSTAAEASANLFAPNKVTINFINCTHNGNKITFNSPEKIAGTKNVNTQLVYVYYDYTGFINYTENRYPTITCN